MRYLLFIVLALGFSIDSDAQKHWSEIGIEPTSNFYQVQDAFNQYWEGKTIEKGMGYKQFKRWESFMVPRVYPSGKIFAPDVTQKALEEMKTASSNSKSMSGTWSYTGNKSVPNGGGGAGRINAVRGHPTDPSIIFACAPSGGLWRSGDFGESWVTLTDGLAHIGVTDVLIDPTNPQIMYLATGDGDQIGTYSIGVLKSTDGGSTWNPTGLNWEYQQTRQISKLIFHKTNTSVLFAATSTGIHKSSDAGASWTEIETGDFKDIEQHETDPNIIFAAGDTFFKSMDGGNSFDPVANGIPDSGVSRMAIATCPSDPSRIYVLAGSSVTNRILNVYRSEDSGSSFIATNANSVDLGAQSSVNIAIAVDPLDADKVFIGMVFLKSSTDGGLTWEPETTTGYESVKYVHADHHDMQFIDGKLHVAGDGGVFRRSLDGTSFRDLSHGLDVAQIYDVESSEINLDLVLSSWQDNGTNLMNLDDWKLVVGNDGTKCLIDFDDNDIMYACIQSGTIYKSLDKGQTVTEIVSRNGTGVNAFSAFVVPFEMAPSDHNTLYLGKKSLYRSSDGGDSWVNLFTPVEFLTHEIGLAQSNPNRIYLSASSSIYTSQDNGLTFTDITSSLPDLMITSITVSEDNDLEVWVTVSGFESGKKVYHSINAGLSWASISVGIPNLPVNCIIQKQGSDNELFCGTDIGVFYREGDTSDWVPYGTGLPNVPVFDLEENSLSHTLYAASYGRGLWKYVFPSETNIDCGIQAIIEPIDESSCQVEYTPQVVVRNFGNDALTSFELQYNFDGSQAQTFNWTGVLSTGQTTVVALPPTTLSPGAHAFNARTDLPNQQIDEDQFNDGLSVDFEILPHEITVQIVMDQIGNRTTWIVTDDMGGVVGSGGVYPVEDAPGEYPQPDVNICLAAGCYTYTIMDIHGDGICNSPFWCGSYKILDADGNILASGEDEWTTSESVNFCIGICPVDIDTDVSAPSDCYLEDGSILLTSPSTFATLSYLISGAVDQSSTGSLQVDGLAVGDHEFNYDSPDGCNFDFTVTVPFEECPADLNDDGFVNGDDFSIFLGVFGTECCPSDINKDGFVNSTDHSLFLGALGTTCADCQEDINEDGSVNALDYSLLIGALGAACGCCPGDLNHDGFVDGADFSIFLGVYGTECDTESKIAAHNGSVDIRAIKEYLVTQKNPRDLYEVNIFPVPTDNIVNISTNAPSLDLIITDAQGRTVKQVAMGSSIQIDTQHLAKGIYSIRDAEGKITPKQFVVSR